MTVRILLPLLAVAAAAAFIPDSRAESPATPEPRQGGGPQDRQGISARTSRGHRRSHPGSAGRSGNRGIRSESAPRSASTTRRCGPTRCRLSPGNPKGDVTLVEFFDYQCGYCKRSLKPVRDLLETDRQLRIVWKEFPILGPVSRFAARAADGPPGSQGRYLEFHVAVMGSRGKLTEDRVMALAGSVGLDVQRLRRDHGRSRHRGISRRNDPLGPSPRHPWDPRLRDRRHPGARRRRRRTPKGTHRRGRSGG